MIIELPLNSASGLDRPVITDRTRAFKKASDVASITSTVVSHDASKLLVE
jgi:hypothetical protein